MKVVILAALLSIAAFSASAQTATCKAQADEKKLAGAALKSFTTKCERDAKAACDASAKEKKLAGAAKTIVFGFATLNDVHWHTSGEVVLMTLLGGIGTILGPIVGSTLVVMLQSELADRVGSKVTIIMGLVFIACVLSFRRGIVGEFIAWRARRASSQRISDVDGRAVVSDAAE